MLYHSLSHCDSFRLDPPDKIGTDFVNIVIHERARSAVTTDVERYGNIFELRCRPLGTPTEWCEVEG